MLSFFVCFWSATAISFRSVVRFRHFCAWDYVQCVHTLLVYRDFDIKYEWVSCIYKQKTCKGIPPPLESRVGFKKDSEFGVHVENGFESSVFFNFFVQVQQKIMDIELELNAHHKIDNKFQLRFESSLLNLFKE